MKLPNEFQPVVTERVTLELPEADGIREAVAELTLAPLTTGAALAPPPRQLRLTGQVSFTRHGECARCLKPARARVESSFETLIDLDAGTTQAIDLETPPETGGFARGGEGELDVREEIRQRIYLAAPEIVYCRTDCRGLCSRCGADLNHGDCGCDRDGAGGPFAALKVLLPEL